MFQSKQPHHEDSLLRNLCLGLIMIAIISACAFCYIQFHKDDIPTTYLGSEYISVPYPASQI